MLSNKFGEQFFPQKTNGNTQFGKVSNTSVPTTDDISIKETSIHYSSVPEDLASQTENNATIDGDMDLFLKSILSQTQAKLAFSENIHDVANVFKQAEELIGKADFVVAIMISYIREERLWKRYGYASMNRFLDDLPGVCKVSRQTFNNAAQAGDVIRYLSSLHPKSVVKGLDFSLTPALLYRNYSKMKFLYRIFYVWNMYITNEVLVNFRDMTYRDFENFIKDYEVQNKAEIERNGKRIKKPSQKKAHVSQSDPQQGVIPELTEVEVTICREIKLGHIVGYLFNATPACAESVVRFLSDARQHKYDEIWNGFYPPSDIYYKNSPATYLCDMDWAELFPGCLIRTVARLTSLCLDLAPHEIKNALKNAFKTRTELTLAQAFLINRMENVPALFESLEQFILQHQIERKHSLVMDFAINILDIEVSKYKWLKRLGDNMVFLSKLKGKVHLASGGFLEKLSYLKTAIDHHPSNLGLVVDALNTASAKRFRKFARNKHDNLSSDPISMRDYLKAKPFIEELRSYQAEGKSISLIGLHTEGEWSQLYGIDRALEHNNEHMRKYYPGIVWDSITKVEGIVEAVSSNEENNEGYSNKMKAA